MTKCSALEILGVATVLALLGSCATRERAGAPLNEEMPAQDSGIAAMDSTGDADLDNPGPSSAPDACALIGPRQLSTLLRDALGAASSVCSERLQRHHCDDAGLCPPIQVHCGQQLLVLNDSGCASRYENRNVPTDLIDELSACIVEQMAGRCESCSTNTMLQFYDSCTD